MTLRMHNIHTFGSFQCKMQWPDKVEEKQADNLTFLEILFSLLERSLSLKGWQNLKEKGYHIGW